MGKVLREYYSPFLKSNRPIRANRGGPTVWAIFWIGMGLADWTVLSWIGRPRRGGGNACQFWSNQPIQGILILKSNGSQSNPNLTFLPGSLLRETKGTGGKKETVEPDSRASLTVIFSWGTIGKEPDTLNFSYSRLNYAFTINCVGEGRQSQLLRRSFVFAAGWTNVTNRRSDQLVVNHFNRVVNGHLEAKDNGRGALSWLPNWRKSVIDG